MSKQKTINTGLEDFKNEITQAVQHNNDDALKTLLGENSAQVSQIKDHKFFLGLAVENKSTRTFAILIENGFNPQKGPTQTLNPIAFAAGAQSAEFLEKYCDAILQKFGPNMINNLINEKDYAGKNALRHALEGRSYAGTIQFLCKNGANLGENLMTNAKLAIENRHNQTLQIILDQSADTANFSEDQILELSNHAKQHTGYTSQTPLKNYAAKWHYSKATDAIDRAISEHTRNYPSSSDIFKICEKGSLEDLRELLKTLKKTKERPLINSAATYEPEYDANGISALFYALINNCYDPLVSELLDQGAFVHALVRDSVAKKDPNRRSAKGNAVDAVTLCIRNKEPKTLGTILRHRNLAIRLNGESNLLLLGNNAFSAIVDEMLSTQYLNAVVLGSFFENVPADRLQDMKDQTLINLTRASLEIVPHKVEERLRNHFKGTTEEKIKTLQQELRSEIPNVTTIKEIVCIPQVELPSDISTKSFDESDVAEDLVPVKTSPKSETRVPSETTRLLELEREVPHSSICSRAYNALRECFGLGLNN